MPFFTPPGKKFGDFHLVEREGWLYCIFIQASEKQRDEVGEAGNSYGLARSRDCFRWEYLGTVKEPGKKGSWDDLSLWAMHVLEERDRYLMAYSAVGKGGGDPHASQQVGFAESQDLRSWRDLSDGPLISSSMTSPYYYPSSVHKFCFRDPVLYRDGSRYHCLLAAKDASRHYERSGCVALFSSRDGLKWSVRKPLFSPGRYWEVETPHVYKVDGTWVLIFGEYTNGLNMRYATSDSFTGPYEEDSLNELTPSQCYAGRIFNWQGTYLFFHWTRDRRAGKKATYFAPPKFLVRRGGRFFLMHHQGLDVYFAEASSVSSLLRKARSSSSGRARLSLEVVDKVRLEVSATDRRYGRVVELSRCAHGLSVRDFDRDDQVNELRTIPLPLSGSWSCDLFLDGRFLEVYVDGYFAHSGVLERSPDRVKGLSVYVDGEKKG